jgi:CheY-like chemotaxis protein/DNA-binding XRE family transcriptional regulator
MITPEQIKAARAMLSIKQSDLAKLSGISIATINNIERKAQTDPKMSTMKAIQNGLERHGIEFINEPLQGIGVHLKPKRRDRTEATILIVDDSNADRMLYKKWLGQAPNKNYRVLEAENAKEGVDIFLEYQPDCLILDFMMYGADGFQVIAALRREQLKLPPIIFVTGMHNEDLEQSARAEKVHAYLNKQMIQKEDLYEAIESALAL